MKATAPQTLTRLHYGWIILVIATLVVFSALGLARFGYTVLLPSMQADLDLNNTQAGVLATANLIGYLALSVIGGALASRFGPRLVIAVGLALAGLGMLLTGLAGGFFSAAVWRALTGIGSGASNVPVMGLLAAWFGTRRRGMAAGIAAGGSSIGLILIGPLVPRLLAASGQEGWRLSWMIFAGVTLFLSLSGYLLLRNDPAEKGLVPMGQDEELSSALRADRTLDWGRVYRAPRVWHLGLVYIAFGFSYIIYVTFFTKRLVSEGRYSPEAAGSLFMAIGWLSLLCGWIWGAVSDHLGRKMALIMVYSIQAVSFSLFALWPRPAGFTISAVLFGLTAWSIPAIMAAACGDALGPRLAAAALGFVTLFFGLGQAVGPSVAGAIADTSGSLFGAYLLAGGVAALGAFSAALLPGAADSSGMGGSSHRPAG